MQLKVETHNQKDAGFGWQQRSPHCWPAGAAACGRVPAPERGTTGCREPLLAALDLAWDCGADGLAARVGAELQATGISVPPRPGSGPDALTPSERRIARMAADGATNKEIAQAFFLSVKTIEMHLGHAYRKLDIGSRRELSTAMTTDA